MSETAKGEQNITDRLSHREEKERRRMFPARTLLLAHGQEVSLFRNNLMDPIEAMWERTKFPPVFLELLRERQGAMENYWSLKATFENPEWKKELWEFIMEYLTKEGTSIPESLSIPDIQDLTPSQAIALTTCVVTSLMKYDLTSLHSGESRGWTREDDMSVLALLTEGKNSQKNDHWEGNGVCRNYAAAEHAVFVAIKAHQKPGSPLEQMASFVVTGTEHLPKKVETVDIPYETHAWNVFLLTPQAGEVHVSIVDPTWTATEKSHESSPYRLSDYTIERMEGFIYQLADAIKKVEPESWNAISDFYGSMLKSFGRRLTSEAQEKRDYYVYRFLQLTEDIPDDQRELPAIKEILDRIESYYLGLLQDEKASMARHLSPRLRVLAHRRNNEVLKARLRHYAQTRAQARSHTKDQP